MPLEPRDARERRRPPGHEVTGIAIFAQLGLALTVLDNALFSALALVVFVTTFLAPPLLKRLSPRAEEVVKEEHSPIVDLVSES